MSWSSSVLAPMLAALLASGCAARAPAAIASAPGATVDSSGRYGIVTSVFPDVPHRARTVELGVAWVRLDVYWHDLEPEEGVFPEDRWRRLRDDVARARGSGLRVYATLSGTPAWARIWACPLLVEEPAARAACRPADVATWERFVARVIGTFGSDVVYGIWNEPNLDRFLIDAPGAQVYAQLFAAADRARRRIDPRAVLAGPETSHHALSSGYLARALAAMRAHLAPGDVISVHWYPDGPDLAAYLQQVHDLAAGHRVWLTETGANECSEERYAQRLREAADAFERSRAEKLFWYVLHHSPATCEALLRDDEAYTPRAAFATLQDRAR